MPEPAPQLVTEPLGGPPLARRATEGALASEWLVRGPATGEEWQARGADVRASVPPGWFDALAGALDTGGAARDRLTRAAGGAGVVVTTGQQPGLFGGPLYTWAKALSALALANELEVATGRPVAPVFWAATDDTDFLESSWTMVSLPGGAQRLALHRQATDRLPLAEIPLGDVSSLVADLERAAGSAVDPRPLDAVRRAYRADATIGGAYVALLRELLEPLGIAVLDASHRDVVAAARPLLARALDRAAGLESALHDRGAAIRAAGFEPQVPDVAGLSLVFERNGASKRRVSVGRAPSVAVDPAAEGLSPNVLLRPVLERTLLPTVAYLAGPGELAYFAQVSAVADVLNVPRPLALPRWSVTIIEPHVAELLQRHGVSPEDFAAPDAVETRLARARWPERGARALADLRAALTAGVESVRSALAGDGDVRMAPSTVDAIERGVEWRLSRFERRMTAAVKRRQSEMMTELGTVRGALYPGGIRQERALNLIPLLARYGLPLLDRMTEAAREHARGLVTGEAAVPARR